MKYLFRSRTKDHLPFIGRMMIGVLAGIWLAGCGQHADSTQPANNLSQSEPSVTLSAGQLSAIQIAPSSLYRFHNEKDAVGNVNFSDDPAIVQADSTLLTTAASDAVAERELQRAKGLYATHGVSERELEQANSDRQTAAAALDAARSALLVLGKTDGEINQIIASGKSGSSIGQRRGFKIVLANATESDAQLLKVGQPVQVSIGAVPDHEFSGKIAEIYAVVDPTLHRVSFRSEVEDHDNLLRSGMLADVTIEVGKPVDSLSIPANAVVREGDGTMTAWITADRQHFFQKRIEVGKSENGRVQVLKGLQVGQLVVTDGAVLLDNILLAPSGD